MKDIKVFVATHKKYDMPKDSMYIPLHVGAYNKESFGYKKDSINDNISRKNPFFCELTGLYWAYKNIDADYIGLVHYRRYFTNKVFRSRKIKNNLNKVIDKKSVNKILNKYDVILPKKRHYLIENLYDHYKHTMYVEPLDKVRNIIEDLYPDYLEEFDKLKIRRSAHMFNMFIMKKEILNDYSKWLFDILFKLESKMKDNKYDTFHSRFYGRVSELLLDVYINKNNINYKELRILDIENINWFIKIKSFLKAKYRGEKYDKSF